jgi:hypothetical protein
MPTSQTIFSQLMDFIPAYEFRKCFQRYNGNYKVNAGHPGLLGRALRDVH